MAIAGPARVAGFEAARAPKPAGVSLIAVAGCAAAAVAMTLTLANDAVSGPGARAGLNAWLTLTYISAGLIAWSRRPEIRCGPMMVAVGFANFLSSLALADIAVPHTIGEVSGLVPAIVFLHVALGFPDGRLEQRFERPL